jgi:hypothetical protein
VSCTCWPKPRKDRQSAGGKARDARITDHHKLRNAVVAYRLRELEALYWLCRGNLIFYTPILFVCMQIRFLFSLLNVIKKIRKPLPNPMIGQRFLAHAQPHDYMSNDRILKEKC